MARHELIEGYLARLAEEVRWRDDADDVLAEARDHLSTAVERAVARGTDPEVAQREALAAFGDPPVVARALATTRRGVALPTSATRSAGRSALLGAAAWVLFPLAWWSGSALEDRGAAAGPVAYWVGTGALAVAVVLTLIALDGLFVRHGGPGVAGWVARILAAVAVAATFLAWFIPGWGLLIGSAAAVTAIALWREHLAPRWGLAALGAGWLGGIATFAVLRVLEVGRVDEWGDYPAAVNGGLTVGCGLTAVGLLIVGRWLAGEAPAELPAGGTVSA